MSDDSTRTSRYDRDDQRRTKKVKTMGDQGTRNDDDLPAEVEFSRGSRGKFFKSGTALNLPVYLDADVQAYLSARADARGIDVGQLVNELLKKDIELIEVTR